MQINRQNALNILFWRRAKQNCKKDINRYVHLKALTKLWWCLWKEPSHSNKHHIHISPDEFSLKTKHNCYKTWYHILRCNPHFLYYLVMLYLYWPLDIFVFIPRFSSFCFSSITVTATVHFVFYFIFYFYCAVLILQFI